MLILQLYLVRYLDAVLTLNFILLSTGALAVNVDLMREIRKRWKDDGYRNAFKEAMRSDGMLWLSATLVIACLIVVSIQTLCFGITVILELSGWTDPDSASIIVVISLLSIALGLALAERLFLQTVNAIKTAHQIGLQQTLMR